MQELGGFSNLSGGDDVRGSSPFDPCTCSTR
jgi:hypothetical protein